jgi:acetyltransferase-like isoleucine patch superfamily enzyme
MQIGKKVMIAKTAIIHPNVKLGKNVTVEDYCIIGGPLKDGSMPETVIGDNAYIRSFTVIYPGNQIGNNFQTGNKTNIREFNKIGNNVSIGTLSVVEHHVVIEDNVRIHTSAFVPEFSTLKNGCWIGPHVVLTNAKVPLAADAKEKLKGPTIEAGAIVGANSTLSPGITIHKGSLIGSGSNVTKDIEAKTIAYGPSASIKKARK